MLKPNSWKNCLEPSKLFPDGTKGSRDKNFMFRFCVKLLNLVSDTDFAAMQVAVQVCDATTAKSLFKSLVPKNHYTVLY